MSERKTFEAPKERVFESVSRSGYSKKGVRNCPVLKHPISKRMEDKVADTSGQCQYTYCKIKMQFC